MAAAEKTIRDGSFGEQSPVCAECLDTGTVGHWNEVAYFEDRRACTQCDAGRRVDSKIADIVRRAQFDERSKR